MSADLHVWEERLESLKQAIMDQAPVWEETFPDGGTGLIVGVSDAAVVALRWFDSAYSAGVAAGRAQAAADIRAQANVHFMDERLAMLDAARIAGGEPRG